MRYPVIGFQERINFTVTGSKPGLLATSDVFGHDFVSKMDRSSPNFVALASSLRLEPLKVSKARSASASCCD